jgi:histone-lysine N-methyltransferase SETD1
VKKEDDESRRSVRTTSRRFERSNSQNNSDLLNVNKLTKRIAKIQFRKSKIHNWGVFALENITAGSYIAEYVGEVIRGVIADRRQADYEARGVDDYMFRVDNYIVDGTTRGNVARYINHSCDANCETRIVTVDGAKKITIYAKKNVATGEEICYDYKFQRETDPSLKLQCRCGAARCTGWLN